MGGEALVPVLVAFFGGIVFFGVLLWLFFSSSRPYAIPTLIFSVGGSAFAAWLSSPTSRPIPDFGTAILVFFECFFYVGTPLALFALSIRFLRERHT